MRSKRSASTFAGLAVAAVLVAAITTLVLGVREVGPAVPTLYLLAILFLLAVLLISSHWGLRLGLATSVVSTAAFNWFHIPPTGRFAIADRENWLALGVYLAAAVVASTLADAARSRTLEADARRREADLSADLARLLLGATDARDALAVAARRIAETVGLEYAELRLSSQDSDRRHRAIPLVAEEGRVGTLLIPPDTPQQKVDTLNGRVVPALTALVNAALEREKLEEQLVETRALRRGDVLKTALLRSVSHDLRSPLTAIRTAASGVASPTVSREEREELTSVIADESDRLSRLVENLLDLSKLQAGTARPEPDWCSIPEVIHAVAASHELRDAHLDVSLEPDLPLVRADGAQLERALSNLVENGLRHSGGQAVVIRARAEASSVVIRVTDRGPGIGDQERERIFEPFYRSGQDSPGSGGSGLGLAIAKGFVEVNGGRLLVDSLPGQGATFVVDLPVHPAAAAAPTPVEEGAR